VVADALQTGADPRTTAAASMRVRASQLDADVAAPTAQPFAQTHGHSAGSSRWPSHDTAQLGAGSSAHVSHYRDSSMGPCLALRTPSSSKPDSAL
jgi:hypothetical protein